MGRTLPASTQLMFEKVKELKSIYDALWRDDQLKLDNILDSVAQHSPALSNTGTLSPLVVTLILALLEEHKRNDRFYEQILDEVQRLLLESRPLEELEIVDGEVIDEDIQRLAP